MARSLYSLCTRLLDIILGHISMKSLWLTSADTASSTIFCPLSLTGMFVKRCQAVCGWGFHDLLAASLLYQALPFPVHMLALAKRALWVNCTHVHHIQCTRYLDRARVNSCQQTPLNQTQLVNSDNITLLRRHVIWNDLSLLIPPSRRLE